MYEHLGVDPQDAWPITAESRTAPGFGREDRASFYRKGEVGDWKNFASDPFRQWVKEEAGELLVELGYERSNDW
jgi:hypothetical protein